MWNQQEDFDGWGLGQEAINLINQSLIISISLTYIIQVIFTLFDFNSSEKFTFSSAHSENQSPVSSIEAELFILTLARARPLPQY